MGIPTHMAVAMSGLVFAGGAALMIGGAASANAEAVAAAPQHVTLVKSSCGHRRGCGCNRGCGCSRGGNRFRGHHSNRNTFAHNQRIIVINRNNNISRSSGGEFGRHRGFRGFDAFKGDSFKGLDDDDWGDGGATAPEAPFPYAVIKVISGSFSVCGQVVFWRSMPRGWR
jgi:hypothetical protein